MSERKEAAHLSVVTLPKNSCQRHAAAPRARQRARDSSHMETSHRAVLHTSFLTDKAVCSSPVSTRGFIKPFSTLRDRVLSVL